MSRCRTIRRRPSSQKLHRLAAPPSDRPSPNKWLHICFAAVDVHIANLTHPYVMVNLQDLNKQITCKFQKLASKCVEDISVKQQGKHQVWMIGIGAIGCVSPLKTGNIHLSAVFVEGGDGNRSIHLVGKDARLELGHKGRKCTTLKM